MTVRLIRLCRLTEAQTCEGCRETTLDLMNSTRGLVFVGSWRGAVVV